MVTYTFNRVVKDHNIQTNNTATEDESFKCYVYSTLLYDVETLNKKMEGKIKAHQMYRYIKTRAYL